MNDGVIAKTSGMRANMLENLTADYIYLGVKRRRQIDKKVLRSRGIWTLIAFRFQDLTDNDEWGPDKMMLASFKNVSGIYTRSSYIIIGNDQEAEQISDLLSEWFNAVSEDEEVMF